jgi:hypothetical protein
VNTWLDALMVGSSAAGFAVCATGVVHHKLASASRELSTSVHRQGLGASSATNRDGRGSLRDAIAMGAMVLAMTDMVLSSMELLPDVVWGLLMLALSPLLAAGPTSMPRCGFSLHRSLSMIAVAALALAGGHGHEMTSAVTHTHGSADLRPFLLVVGVAILVAYTVILVLTRPHAVHQENSSRQRHSCRLSAPALESCFAVVSVTAMAGAVLI